ncbi:glycyl aminopeptidase [Haladaptatus caseinilyticus]|uniref:glycyl aminopeptidase n=1 Tax=Haladaptatus caseinilyticus TaxID=2993314 RepID=UPI00224AA3A2|nr:glycyl aminopeptidase [Haladaptatus caseinilyticus]
MSSEGFVTGETKNSEHALRWNGETESPSVTVTTDIDEGNGREFTSTDRWILAPTPRLTVAWMPSGDDEWKYRHPLENDYPDATIKFADRGVLGSAFTYIGAYKEHTHHADGQRFRMIVVDGASPSDSPGKVFKSLTSASKRLPGESPDKVLAFVLPDPSWRGGYASPSHDEIWVHEDAHLSDPQNLWLHEYVHTRQSFKLGDRMAWFREASAAYFASNLTMEQGRTSKSDVAQMLTRNGFDESVLSKSNTWASNEVPYYRGAYALWALDAKIRKATDGDRSLFDVFERMNAHKGPISYADFRAIVANVAEQSMNSWLNEHVTTSATPKLQDITSGLGGYSESGDVRSSNDGKASNRDRNYGISNSDRFSTMTGDLSSTLILSCGLGLIGLMFGLTLAQYISRLIERVWKR